MPVLEDLRDTNGHHFTREQIGILKIDEPIVERQTYELAAWWTAIKIDRGSYPVYRTNRDTGRSDVYVTVPGSVVDEFMPSLYGGVPITRGRDESRIGRRTTMILRGYHNAADPFEHTVGVTFEPIP